MSVRIVRKEETRNTTVWQFLGVAILPLIVAYFGGLSAGKTLKVDTSISQAQVETMQAHIKALQDSLRIQTKMLAELDSIQKPIHDKFYEFADAIKAAVADAGEDTDGAGDEVMDKAKDYFRDEIGNWVEEKEDFLDKNNMYTPLMKSSLSLFDKIIELHKGRLQDKQTISENKVNDSAISAAEQEKGDLDDEINELKTQLRIKDIQIEGLKNQNSGGTQNSNSAILSLAESKVLSEAISGEVNTIRTTILPKLKSGKIFANKQEIAELNREIGARITIISEKAVAIKSLK